MSTFTAFLVSLFIEPSLCSVLSYPENGGSIFLCEMSVPICQTIQCHIPEDTIFHVCSCNVLGHLYTGLVSQLPPLSCWYCRSLSAQSSCTSHCYHAVWTETVVDFGALKIWCIIF